MAPQSPSQQNQDNLRWWELKIPILCAEHFSQVKYAAGCANTLMSGMAHSEATEYSEVTDIIGNGSTYSSDSWSG